MSVDDHPPLCDGHPDCSHRGVNATVHNEWLCEQCSDDPEQAMHCEDCSAVALFDEDALVDGMYWCPDCAIDRRRDAFDDALATVIATVTEDAELSSYADEKLRTHGLLPEQIALAHRQQLRIPMQRLIGELQAAIDDIKSTLQEI